MAKTDPTAASKAPGTGVTTPGERPLPISSENRELVAQQLAKMMGKTPEEVKGIRVYYTAAIKLSEVVVKSMRAWSEDAVCVAKNKNPTLDDLLSPPKAIGIQTIRGWKDGKPIFKGRFVSEILPQRMTDFWVSLVQPRKGDTSGTFTPFLPLLNGKENSAATTLKAAATQCHRGMSGLPQLKVEPELVGESEAELLKRRAALAAKRQGS
jgi:hypothetical protein